LCNLKGVEGYSRDPSGHRVSRSNGFPHAAGRHDLRPVPGGGVEVWSDKKEVSPFTAYDGELEIIGRVVAVQRKL